jgi:SAM-dependent methyltransferase
LKKADGIWSSRRSAFQRVVHGRVAPRLNSEMSVSLVELNPRNGWLGWWPRAGFRATLDPENARINAFLQEEAARLADGASVLDAGAGTRQYEKLFHRQHYQSCDMADGFYKCQHDFECQLDRIPKPDAIYDTVILTQVLEHVPNPEAVLAELNRVLKPGGSLLMTVPLNGPLHGEPWHFFQFTHYGLAELAKRTNFVIVKCEKVGGAFWLLGKRTADLPRQVMKQMDPFRAKRRGRSVVRCVIGTILFLPFWLVFVALGYMTRPLCYWLDRLDISKSFTTGYTAVFRKVA